MADNDSEDDERGILCAHYDTSRMPACGKSGAKFCSLVYIILNILTSSLIVHLVGFSTAYWSHGEDFYHTGLWLLCGINKHRCQYLPYNAGKYYIRLIRGRITYDRGGGCFCLYEYSLLIKKIFNNK